MDKREGLLVVLYDGAEQGQQSLTDSLLLQENVFTSTMISPLKVELKRKHIKPVVMEIHVE